MFGVSQLVGLDARGRTGSMENSLHWVSHSGRQAADLGIEPLGLRDSPSPHPTPTVVKQLLQVPYLQTGKVLILTSRGSCEV